jgi:hypothetical protein
VDPDQDEDEGHFQITTMISVISTAMSDAVRALKSRSITISKVSASGIGRTLLEEGFRPPVDHFIQAFL